MAYENLGALAAFVRKDYEAYEIIGYRDCCTGGALNDVTSENNHVIGLMGSK